jgi:tetratricopeptide (TPR) repeat protein
VSAFAPAELGELAEADRDARQALGDFSAARDEWGRGLSLVVRGVVARGLGEPAQARALFTDALRCAQQTGHPLLIGLASTLRGFTYLGLGDAAAALDDAQRVLDADASRDALPAAHVGPRVLRALARQRLGDVAAALCELAEIARDADEPSLLFPRRQAVAAYAMVLLAADRSAEALDWARRAVRLPAEDVRSRALAGQALAAALAANRTATAIFDV